jgi:hypothetical protein
MRILWSPQSLRDLDALHEYIAKDSEHYADLTVGTNLLCRRTVAPVSALWAYCAGAR